MKFVYLLKSYENGYYKIGTSKNPLKRIKELQIGNPEKIEIINSYLSENYSKIEIALHNYYSYTRKTNEWFDLTLEDELNFIDLCKNIDKNLKFLNENEDF